MFFRDVRQVKGKTIFTKAISCLFAVVLIVMSILGPLSVSAAEKVSDVNKDSVSHDIAIVFDNSGSMYEDTDRWSQALYAIGVFASMLDYDSGDKLGIYPMGEISIGKNGKSVSNRLEITKDNISDISKIYSKETSETILKPAYNAVKYLQKSKAEEKWLIVLTDGEFYYDKSIKEKKSQKSASWLNKKMLDLAKGDIKVQYLGFAEASVLNSNVSKNFYASNVSSANELTGELVNICNKIFQRHKVEGFSNGKFSIDVSMNNIIAFVQGKGAEVGSLVGDDNKLIDKTLDTKIESGIEGTGSDYSAPPADISGQVVTFDACKTGTYTLDYTGSDVQIFYEPNVKIQSYLTDSNGKKIDVSKSITPGEYKLVYNLVDGETSEDVSNSKLLSPVALSAEVSNNGKKQTVSSGETIKLDADSNTKILVSGTYLKEYSINNKSDGNFGKINVEMPKEKGLKIKVSTKQFGKWFKLSDKDTWNSVRIYITYDNKKLSDEQIKNLKLSIEPKPSEDLSYTYKYLKGESAFEVNLGTDENGDFIEPKCGDYKLTAKGSYLDEYKREISSEDSLHFSIQWFDQFWLWLIWLVILAALIAIVAFILTRKAWPKHMKFIIDRPRDEMGKKFSITPRNKRLHIVPYENALQCSAEKNSKVHQRLFSKKSMSVKAFNFRSDDLVSFSIGSHQYTANKDFKLKDVDYEIIVNGTDIQVVFDNGTKASGHIEIY